MEEKRRKRKRKERGREGRGRGRGGGREREEEGEEEEEEGEEEEPGTKSTFQRHVASDLSPPTKLHLLKFLPPPNSPLSFESINR
jgi:hypothetical protein